MRIEPLTSATPTDCVGQSQCLATADGWVRLGLGMIVTALMIWSQWLHSPTHNEPAHLATGLWDWHNGEFDVYVVNTPLVRMTAALPLLLTGVEETAPLRHQSNSNPRPEFMLGHDFAAASGRMIQNRLFHARLMCLPFFWLGAVVAHRFATEFWQSRLSGFVAFVLWCVEPTLMAHGELITSDCAAASFGLCNAFAFWCWYREVNLRTTLILGLCTGLAMSVRLGWVISPLLYALVAIALMLGDWAQGQLVPVRRRISSFLGAMLMALLVLNGTYGFAGTFRSLDSFEFASASLSAGSGNRFRDTWIGAVPLPVPAPYVTGLDLQRKDFETPHQETFAAGEWYDRGQWWYYMYGLCVKTTHAHQFLIALALLLAVLGVTCRPRLEWLILIGPAACVIGMASVMDEFTSHFRYIIPAYGFLIVLASAAGATWSGSRQAVVVTGQKYVCVFALVAAGLSAGCAFPHHLAYFNEWSGGVSGQFRCLLHSSLDWGQDLWILESQVRQLPQHEPVTFVGAYSLAPEMMQIPLTTLHSASSHPDSLKKLTGIVAFEATVYRRLMRDNALTELQSNGRVAVVLRHVGGSIVLVKFE